MRAGHAVAAAGPWPDGGAARAVSRLSALPAQPLKRSFPPIVGTNPLVLVLGTLPGEESLRRLEYYAHPRNLLWPIIFGLFGEAVPAEYAARLEFVRNRRIALWDVCAAAYRTASADTTIRTEIPNAIEALLDAHPGIRAVAFNGSTARRLYDRHFARRPGLAYLALPSTSPAHARLGLAEKLAAWQALAAVLESS